MARYVVVIKVARDGQDTDVSPGLYLWEVRELLSDATGSLLERSGPTLVRGTAPDVVTAKHEAETWAESLANEEVYLYNTNTQEPTPPLP